MSYDQRQPSQVRGLLQDGKLRIIYVAEERPTDSRRVSRGRVAVTLRYDELLDIIAHLTSRSLEEVKANSPNPPPRREELSKKIESLLKERGLLEEVAPSESSSSYATWKGYTPQGSLSSRPSWRTESPPPSPQIRGEIDQMFYIVDGAKPKRIALMMELDELYSILAHLKDLPAEELKLNLPKEVIGDTLEAQRSVLVYKIRKALQRRGALANLYRPPANPVREVEGRVKDGVFWVRIDHSPPGVTPSPLRFQWREAESTALTALYVALAFAENTTLEAVVEAYSEVALDLRRETVIGALRNTLLR